MMRFALCMVVAVLLMTVSCIKSSNNSNSCTYDACQAKAPEAEIASLKAYLDTNHINAIKHCSGLYYIVVAEGTGTAPTPCSSVAVNYKGTLTNGTVFDATTSPVAFNLLSLITGWKNGIPLIKKGGKIKLFIPPSLGYGSGANGSIPGNSILIFDIELLDFQ